MSSTHNILSNSFPSVPTTSPWPARSVVGQPGFVGERWVHAPEWREQIGGKTQSRCPPHLHCLLQWKSQGNTCFPGGLSTVSWRHKVGSASSSPGTAGDHCRLLVSMFMTPRSIWTGADDKSQEIVTLWKGLILSREKGKEPPTRASQKFHGNRDVCVMYVYEHAKKIVQNERPSHVLLLQLFVYRFFIWQGIFSGRIYESSSFCGRRRHMGKKTFFLFCYSAMTYWSMFLFQETQTEPKRSAVM